MSRMFSIPYLPAIPTGICRWPQGSRNRAEYRKIRNRGYGRERSSGSDGLVTASVVSKDLVICSFGTPGVGLPIGDYFQLYDTQGNCLNQTQFERIGLFEDGLAPFLLEGKLGIIDENGTIVFLLPILWMCPSMISLVSAMGLFC